MPLEFIARNGVIALASSTISGSLTVTNGITGSLEGTATTASYILSAISSSFASTASYSDSFTVGGTLTAQRIVVQTISSSVVFSSGSNRFGNDITNTQSFTGSVGITGSLTLNGVSAILGSGTTNYLPKFTGTTAIGNSQVFDNGTNVFIGTTTGGSDKLNVLGNAVIGRSNITSQVYIGLGVLGSVTPSALFWSFGLLANSNDFNIQSYDGTTLSSQMRIFGSSGNISINSTTDNGYRQQINGSGSASGSLFVSGSSVFSGSVTSTLGFTGSLFGTSSYATTASYLIGQSATSSFSLTASYVNPLRQNIQLTGSLNISGSTTALSLFGSGSGVFSVDGTSGRLFSIDDSLSGSLFSVNTAAGLPVMEAFSDNTVRIGQFGQKALFISSSGVGIGKETPLNSILDVSGSIIVTGSITSTVGFTGSLIGTASYATTSSYATNFTVGNSLVVSGSLNVTGSILQNGGGLAVQDGTILYYSSSWFTPSSTVSTSGATVTSVGTQFTSAMVGAKLTILGESRLIIGFTSNTQVTVDSAYSQNYSGVASSSWRVSSKSFATADSTNPTKTNVFYDASGNQKSYFDSNGNIIFTSTYTIANNTLSAGTFFSFGTTAGMRFASVNNDANVDVRLRRISAGTVQIDNGSSDTAYRDLILRNITGSNATFSGSVNISGSLILSPSSSFVLPLTASVSPITGSAYWSGSFLFIYNGTGYMSSSFA